jgi:hypothetical protein
MEYVKNRLKIFFNEFLSPIWVIVFFVAYTVFKIWSNINMGASLATSLRSGILEAVFYLAGCYAI